MNDQQDDRPIVVGVGASAGGLDAISQLLKGLPDDSGMSFVIIQHLDPTHKSAGPNMSVYYASKAYALSFTED